MSNTIYYRNDIAETQMGHDKPGGTGDKVLAQRLETVSKRIY
jgi:hypothetical protein